MGCTERSDCGRQTGTRWKGSPEPLESWGRLVPRRGGVTAAAAATPLEAASQTLRSPGLGFPFSPPEPLPDPALPAWQARAPTEPPACPSVRPCCRASGSWASPPLTPPAEISSAEIFHLRRMRDQNSFPGYSLFFPLLARGRPGNVLQCLLLKHLPDGFRKCLLHGQPHKESHAGSSVPGWGHWLSCCSPGSPSPSSLGTIEPSPMEPQFIFLRCCSSGCGGHVGSCKGLDKGKWLGCPRRGKGRTRRGIPSFCSGPKVVFVWWLVKKNPNPQSKAGLA